MKYHFLDSFSLSASANFLFERGWRACHRDTIGSRFNFSVFELDEICKLLSRYEAEAENAEEA